jgi:hypothetical protein
MVGDNIGVMKNPFAPLRGVGSGGTDTLEEERLAPTDDGDHERFAHYVRKEKITEAMVTGKPVRALCGKKWVPSRDPEKYPVCPTCKEIYDGLKKE